MRKSVRCLATLRRVPPTFDSIGFSAGGLLFPYHVGVLDVLRSAGALHPRMAVAGASAGSLIAAAMVADVPTGVLLNTVQGLSRDLRQQGTFGRVRPLLKVALEALLPEDIHLRANGRCHVAITHVPHNWRPWHVAIVSEFVDKQDFISAVLASCHVPFYLDGNFSTIFRGDRVIDGGLISMLPVPSASLKPVRVCCFPVAQIAARVWSTKMDIAPDASSHSHPSDLSLGRFLYHGLFPGDEELTTRLFEKGVADAQIFLNSAEGGGLT
jgi:predicted acylesterase/phospholipase RssA